jgi:hypothetical protein
VCRFDRLAVGGDEDALTGVPVDDCPKAVSGPVQVLVPGFRANRVGLVGIVLRRTGKFGFHLAPGSAVGLAVVGSA